MDNSNQAEREWMFVVGLILMGLGVLLSTIFVFFFLIGIPAFVLALSLIWFSKKPLKTRALSMILPVAIIPIFWLSLYGYSRIVPSSDPTNEELAWSAGSGQSSEPGAAEDFHDIAANNPPAVKEPMEWKTFRGGYFDVQYPASFTVESSGEEDGILFVAPDRSVQFYVFSPLWNGESKHYDVDPENEIVKQHSVEREGSRRITRLTYQDRTNHQMRSFEDVEDTLYNTRRIFGVFYSNQSAYSEYKDLYLKFKKSLKQYADH